MKEKKRKKKRVIPGFGLSFGITIAMLGFIGSCKIQLSG